MELCVMTYLSTSVHAQLKQGVHRLQQEVDDLAKILVACRLDRTRREIKYHDAILRVEKALTRNAFYCPKAGFDTNQPRLPAGTREGGQWTRDAGSVSNRIVSDTTPDPVVPGAQYAQTRIEIAPSALTGISTIDNTTKTLANTLASVVDILPAGSGPVYGIAVHAAFANAVRAQNIPGISFSDVETTFSLANSFRYGSKDSIRTDVILRNDVGDIRAIYDVKTGDATIAQSRADELRTKTRVGPDVPVIELNLKRGVMLKNAIGNRRWPQAKIGVVYVHGN